MSGETAAGVVGVGLFVAVRGLFIAVGGLFVAVGGLFVAGAGVTPPAFIKPGSFS